MSAKCEVCGKKTVFGNSITRRGKAKYLGGVGRKVTGITRRKFRVNIQKVRVELPNGSKIRLRVCAQCIRDGGAVTKRLKREIPKPVA